LCVNSHEILTNLPGGKKFSRDIRPLDADGNEVSMWAAGEKPEGDSDDDESSEEETSEEEDDEPEAGPAEPETQEESREARKAEKKARKEAAIAKLRAKTVEVGDMPSSDESESESDDDDMPANPNHSKEARKQAAVGMEEITEGVEGLKAAPTRREREALEAAAAKEKHMRLTAQGKTDQSKADLERLKAIREQRALDAARREVSNQPLLDTSLNFDTNTIIRPSVKRRMSKKRPRRPRLRPGRLVGGKLPLARRARRNRLSQ
jgi:hypothetical protein